jgi:SAM-dependent methyltransferase
MQEQSGPPQNSNPGSSGGSPPRLDASMQHPNLPLWTAMIGQLQRRARGNEKVLDYGCGEGQFLRVLHRTRPFAEGVGVDIDSTALERGRATLTEDEPIELGAPDLLNQQPWSFDLVFAQEVFWMIEDLGELAARLHSLTKNGGECYATVGCHVGNPLWEHRKAWLQEQGFTAFDYSIDDVAKVFFEAGFEVGVKRLPVDEFTGYHPVHTPMMTRSLAEQVAATAEHKMLFHFRRDDELRNDERRDVSLIN